VDGEHDVGAWQRRRRSRGTLVRRRTQLALMLSACPWVGNADREGWLWAARSFPDSGFGAVSCRLAAPARRHYRRVIIAGHGLRGGKAMIATLRWRLIGVPGRLVRHAGQLILRLPPGRGLLAEVLARLRALPATS